MLSKGGKISFACPACESRRIINSKKGLAVQGPASYVGIAANSYVCIDCGAHGKWSARLKVSNVDDVFDGELTIPIYQELVGNIDNLHTFVKRTITVSKPTKSYDTKAAKRKPPKIPVGGTSAIGVRWSPDGKADCSHWTHRPTDFGLWVGYNNWRFKCAYDVMNKDGEVFKKCYPNGSAFHHSSGDIHDCDVIVIRLCTFEDLEGDWRTGGETKEESDLYRAERNADMFGDNTPEDWMHIEPVEFDPETMQLKKSVEEWGSDDRIGEAPADMAFAHRVIAEECGLYSFSFTNMRCDEQLLFESIPGYEVDPKFVPIGVEFKNGQFETKSASYDSNDQLIETYRHDVGRGHTEPFVYVEPLPYHKVDVSPALDNIIKGND